MTWLLAYEEMCRAADSGPKWWERTEKERFDLIAYAQAKRILEWLSPLADMGQGYKYTAPWMVELLAAIEELRAELEAAALVLAVGEEAVDGNGSR